MYRRTHIQLEVELPKHLNKYQLRQILKQNLDNQVDGFLGAGIPLASKLWSKAGLMSEVRHDVAWWESPNKNPMLAVVFTTGKELVKDQFLLPAISSELNKLAI